MPDQQIQPEGTKVCHEDYLPQLVNCVISSVKKYSQVRNATLESLKTLHFL